MLTKSHLPVACARNVWRHPVESPEFFGLEADNTVIEILPSTGWHTEIITPYVCDQGKYYAAHFSPNAAQDYLPRIRGLFEEKISSDPDHYARITVRSLNPPHEVIIAPPASADMALTFRNVHNWIMAGQEHEFFAAFFAALKPGGTLGVVEHRDRPDASMEIMETIGYVTEAYVKEVAAAAGFEFVESSDINANAKDDTDHPTGVWSLPPTYRMGEANHDDFTAIGESDRMTLKFIKPRNWPKPKTLLLVNPGYLFWGRQLSGALQGIRRHVVRRKVSDSRSTSPTPSVIGYYV